MPPAMVLEAALTAIALNAWRRTQRIFLVQTTC
jgi:hypothetical protein